MKSTLPSYHPHVNDAALDRLLTRFDAALMSNAKWVRLLDVLTAPPDIVVECKAKLVWDDVLRSFRIADAQYQFDYWDNAVEALISGPPRGWYQYREIEWIAFPRIAMLAAGPAEQDLSAIRARIHSAGRFEINDDPDELRLYAYRSLYRAVPATLRAPSKSGALGHHLIRVGGARS